MFVWLLMVFIFMGCEGKTSSPVDQKSTKSGALRQTDSTGGQPALQYDTEEFAAGDASAEKLLGIITNDLTLFEEEESIWIAREQHLKAELANVLSNRTRLQQFNLKGIRFIHS